MSITLSELYTQTKGIYQLELLAGSRGIDNIMNWVYVSEDLNNAEFIQGGELVITTGVSLEFTEDWLYKFVRTMIEHNTAGMILNIGKYIKKESITKEVIKLCEDNDYPLFSMPWNIHIYDVTKDYCNRIFIETKAYENNDKAFISVINKDSHYRESLDILINNGYEINGEYRLCIMKGLNINNISASLKLAIESIINFEKNKCSFFYYNMQLIFIFKNQSCYDYEGILPKLKKTVMDYSKCDEVNIGIGGVVKNIDNLHEAYFLATAALKMAHFNNKEIYKYEDMGLFKILFKVNDNSVLESYVGERLGNVLEYDSKHKSSMYETLRSYIKHDGSIQAVADELVCHRNTINNRIKLIRESIMSDIDSPVMRTEIMMAYIIRDYLDMQEQEDRKI